MNNDRTILHRADLPPEAAGGKMVMLHQVTDIVGAAIQPDTKNVAIKMEVSSGDRLVLGFTLGGIDAMIEALRKTREQLDDEGVERTIPFSPVHTAQVGTHTHDAASFVALIIDRSLPSAAAFLMPPANALAVAKNLRTAARAAALARGEVVRDVE